MASRGSLARRIVIRRDFVQEFILEAAMLGRGCIGCVSDLPRKRAGGVRIDLVSFAIQPSHPVPLSTRTFIHFGQASLGQNAL